jgi:hypothetical protein
VVVVFLAEMSSRADIEDGREVVRLVSAKGSART